MKISEIRNSIIRNRTEIIFAVLFLILVGWVWITDIPNRDQDKTLIKIKEGTSLKATSDILKENRLIRSKILFDSIVVIEGKDNKIVSGEYLFEGKNSIFQIIKRITTGDFGIPTKTVTLKEGFELKEMAYTLSKAFPNVSYEKFMKDTEDKEGYYFPDTYIFPENVDTETVEKTLHDTFLKKVSEIDNVIKKSPNTLDEIIVMASIIEKEATDGARQEVSNILWRRIKIGMPLQVDATFVYERDKGTFDLTKADLKKDSPYNTYTNKGLPPTAISNPGIESIKAAANPQPTKNLYFLTGKDGNMYYASTLEGHKKNRVKLTNA